MVLEVVLRGDVGAAEDLLDNDVAEGEDLFHALAGSGDVGPRPQRALERGEGNGALLMGMWTLPASRGSHLRWRIGNQNASETPPPSHRIVEPATGDSRGPNPWVPCPGCPPLLVACEG